MVKAVVGSRLPDGKVFTCEILAKIFKLEAKRVRNLCSTGQIPFVRRVGRVWIIRRAGAEFLERWLRKDRELPRLKLREAAGKLDPEALERQPELPPEPDLLSDADVRKIRKSSKPLSSLAIQYDRSRSALSRIQKGTRYSRVK